MRAKLAQVIESNSKNTDAGNGQLEKVLFSNETFLGSNKNSESMEKVFKTAFSMDQERLIGQMQAELAIKDKLKIDYNRLRQKYLQRKEEWTKHVQMVEQRERAIKDDIVAELQSQISFYRSQSDDFQKRLHQELKEKQREYESAMVGTQNYRHALISTEHEVNKLNSQIDHLNQLLQKSDTEIDRYRSTIERVRLEAIDNEATLRKQIEDAVKETKVQQKTKYRQQIEQLEHVNQQKLALRIEETRQTCSEFAQKDLELQMEKFENKMKTEYLPVAEHEDIVRQIQNKDLDSQRRMLEDAQANKEAQLEQI